MYAYEDGYHGDVYLVEYEIARETKCGYWVRKDVYAPESFVMKNGKKKMCYLTKEEAMIGYYHRKRRQVEILAARLKYAKIRKGNIETMMEKEGLSAKDRNDSRKYWRKL